LAKPASNIDLGDVIGDTEPDFALVECFATGNQCVNTSAASCGACFARRYTLESIALRPRDFREALQSAS
jgi:Rrf2 family nitric oxide-sensitive transcriptional repressor